MNDPSSVCDPRVFEYAYDAPDMTPGWHNKFTVQDTMIVVALSVERNFLLLLSSAGVLGWTFASSYCPVQPA